MTLLRCTYPADKPPHKKCDFVEIGAVFELQAEQVLRVCSIALQRHLDREIHLPLEWGWHARAAKIADLRDKLCKAVAEGCDLNYEDRDFDWKIIADIIFNKQFVWAICPRCQAEMGPEEYRIKRWFFGEMLAARGGWRLACPSDHTLYSFVTLVS